MENRKPNKVQQELIQGLIREMSFWAVTNDLYSPTHNSDLREFLQAIDDLPEEKLDDIIDHAQEILNIIRSLKDDN